MCYLRVKVYVNCTRKFLLEIYEESLTCILRGKGYVYFTWKVYVYFTRIFSVFFTWKRYVTFTTKSLPLLYVEIFYS